MGHNIDCTLEHIIRSETPHLQAAHFSIIVSLYWYKHMIKPLKQVAPQFRAPKTKVCIYAH